jgi:hypothetical protein
VLKRDLILQLIEELNRVTARVAALRGEGQLAAAEAEVDGAAQGLVGLDLGLTAGLAPAALVPLVGEPHRLAAAARLMLLRSDLAGDRGDEDAAGRWYGNAVEVWLEAAAAGAPLDAEAREAIEAWPAGTLSARGRELRARLPPAGR